MNLTPRFRSRLLIVSATCAVALFASSCGLFSSGYPREIERIPNEFDISYGPVLSCAEPSSGDCGGSQTLDIYYSDVEGPNPVLVWVHGGGFVAGDKTEVVPGHLERFLEEGWDLVAINYRLATETGANPFPTGLHDVKRAIRWVKANAGDYDWDADSVAVIGHSAGGGLVALVATTANEPLLEPTDLPAELNAVDSTVIAAMSIAGVFNMEAFLANEHFGPMAAWYLGCSDCPPERLAAASVVPHVDENSAPLYMLHGVNDPVAGPDHGEPVHEAYAALGLEDIAPLRIVTDGNEAETGHDPPVYRYHDEILELFSASRPNQSGIAEAAE